MKKIKTDAVRLQLNKVNISALTAEEKESLQGGTSSTMWWALHASSGCPPPDPGDTGCVDCGVCPRF